MSKQLRDTQELIFRLHKNLIQVSGVLAQTQEERRREDEKKGKRFEIQMFYRSLVLGLSLGILGNLLASYYIKALEILVIPTYIWIVSTIGMLIGVFAVVWLLHLEIKKLIKETSSS